MTNYTVDVVTDEVTHVEHYMAKHTVANEAALLLLDQARRLDIAYRQDTQTAWQLIGDDPSDLDSWHEDKAYVLPSDVARVDSHGNLVPAPEYVHNQTLASATWTIVHNRNKKLGVVEVLDSNDIAICFFSVHHLTDNSVELGFGASMTGRARLL